MRFDLNKNEMNNIIKLEMENFSKFVAERIPNGSGEKSIWVEVANLTKKHSALNFGMGKWQLDETLDINISKIIIKKKFGQNYEKFPSYINLGENFHFLTKIPIFE